jgi:hypothetical protein
VYVMPLLLGAQVLAYVMPSLPHTTMASGQPAARKQCCKISAVRGNSREQQQPGIERWWAHCL